MKKKYSFFIYKNNCFIKKKTLLADFFIYKKLIKEAKQTKKSKNLINVKSYQFYQ